MSTTITVNGNTYTIPATGETGWGSEVSNLLSTLGDGFLQKYTGQAPGTTIDFTLGADIDYGTTYGAFYKYITSKSSTPATAGFLRLADGDAISWRYNNANYDLKVLNGVLLFDGKGVLVETDTTKLTNRTLESCTIDVTANTVSGIKNANIASDAAIAQSKIDGLVTALAGKEPTVTKGNLTTATTGVTITGGTGAVIGSGTTVNIATASAVTPGLLSAADYARFDGAAPQNLAKIVSGTTGINVSANTDSIIAASDITISANTASSGQQGLLSPTDWTTFNNKQSLIAQEVKVAKSGGAYTSIQSAISSITDATSSKPYVVTVQPGVYTEDIIIKDWVFIRGIDTKGCVLNGKITGTINSGQQGGVNTLTINGTPNTAANYRAVDITGDVVLENLVINITPGSSFSGDITGIYMTGTQITYSGLIGVNLFALAGTISKFCGFHFLGASALSLYQSATTIVCTLAAGEYSGFCVANTGDSGVRQLLTYAQFLNPSFAGTVIAYDCDSVQSASSNIRVTEGCAAVLKGSGGGTAYGTRLSTIAGGASFRHDSLSLHVDGFTAGQEYMATTGTNDSQKLWVVSQNKDLPQQVAGLSVATPQDQNMSGFVRWGGSGDYYSFDVSTGVFTILRPGAGVVKSSPVTWPANQTTTIASLATAYVYVDSTGVLRNTTNASGLFSSNIVLFEVWRDGTEKLVVKENHPYEFTTAVSGWAHLTFGSSVTGTGANITQLGVAANRQLAIVGDDTLIDHGLTSTITSSPGVAATFRMFYTNGSGKMIQDGTSLTTFLSRYNNAGTPTNAANNQRVVFRLGVLKDGLNSPSPIFAGVLHTTTYGNDASALAAISNGSIVAFPEELRNLEIVQLGFLVISANGSGGGSIIPEGVVVNKQAFGTTLIGASSSNQASLITTTTTNFSDSGGVIASLSGADTTAQAAFDTIARGKVARYQSAITWGGSAGAYTFSVSGAAHTRGNYPKVEIYSLVPGETTVYEPAHCNHSFDNTNGNVIVYSPDNFTGLVVIY